MQSFKQWLNEAGIVNMERYIRAHGKRPRTPQGAGPMNYMFTTKRMGSVDYNNSDEVFEVRDTWANAKKKVAQWAKKIGASQVYVMEETGQNPENKEADASNHEKPDVKGPGEDKTIPKKGKKETKKKESDK